MSCPVTRTLHKPFLYNVSYCLGVNVDVNTGEMLSTGARVAVAAWSILVPRLRRERETRCRKLGALLARWICRHACACRGADNGLKGIFRWCCVAAMRNSITFANTG